MVRQIFGVMLLALVWARSQPLLADENSGRQDKARATQAGSNDRQTSAGGANETQAVSGPALPAPDGSNTANASSSQLQNQQRASAGTSDNRQVDMLRNIGRSSSASRQDVPRTGGRNDVGDLRTDSFDRAAARNDDRDDHRIEARVGDRERSYLSRAPRELPVYFGAEFEPNAEGMALVTRVDQGSPADRAGLRPDDMVLSLNGEKVSSADDALAILSSMRAGERLDVEYSRQARGRALLADSRGSSVASRYSDDRADVQRTYDDSRRVEYNSRYDSSRYDSSRDRPRTERRVLGIFRRR